MRNFLLLSALFFAFLASAFLEPAFGDARFRLAVPGYRYQFPRDHGAHPQFASEWWYYTGHLRAQNGREFGFQLTWFRVALSPTIQRKSKWAARDLMFAHFAITDVSGQKFYFTDTIGRANLGLSGADVNARSPRVWCGGWVLQFGGKTGEIQNFSARGQSDAAGTRGENMALRLRLSALKPPVFQGQNGVSQKSAGGGRASHYYSFTRMQSEGDLQIGGQKWKVSGQSWLDREWGSSQLAKDQVGWDWFALQLDDGRELMLYRLRLRNGGVEPFSSGSLIEKNGTKRHLKRADFRLTPLQNWVSPQTKASYPTQWQIEVPGAGLRLQTHALVLPQELVPIRSGQNLSYWEGAISVAGVAGKRKISGRGYLEMTGYASAFNKTF